MKFPKIIETKNNFKFFFISKKKKILHYYITNIKPLTHYNN